MVVEPTAASARHTVPGVAPRAKLALHVAHLPALAFVPHEAQAEPVLIVQAVGRTEERNSTTRKQKQVNYSETHGRRTLLHNAPVQTTSVAAAR